MAKTGTRDRDQTEARILRAAAELLAQGGPQALSINGLAAAAGVGKPLLYRYFGDLEGVLDALTERTVGEAAWAREAVPEGAPVLPATYRMLRFGRRLSKEPVLRALFRALLAGGLSKGSQARLLSLLPGDKGDAAARALLLGGISFVVLLKDSCRAFGGVRLDDPKELARLEGVLVALAGQIER
jgi:AcrR family transcriptional regulator